MEADCDGIKVLEKCDPSKQSSLQREAEIDPMEGEQTWPTEEELAQAEGITHSSTQSRTHSLTHLLTHPFTHSLTHSSTHSLIHSQGEQTWLTEELAQAEGITHSSTQSRTHSPTYSLIHSFTHSSTHSFTHSNTADLAH